jgi:hypothetical protein
VATLDNNDSRTPRDVLKPNNNGVAHKLNCTNYGHEDPITDEKSKKLKNPSKISPDNEISQSTDLTCTYCDKTFTRKDNLAYHQEFRCKKKKELDGSDKFKYLSDKILILERTISELQKKSDGQVIIKNTENSNNNINSNNVNNQYDIKIIAFGEEKLFDRIGNDVAKKYLAKGYQSVMGLIDYVHFNDEFPELQNVYISNNRDTIAHVFNGIKWETKPKDEVVNVLFDDKQCFLLDMYKEVKDTMSAAGRTKFERFMNEKDPIIIDGLKLEIKRHLYNNREKPMNRKKAMESRKR